MRLYRHVGGAIAILSLLFWGVPARANGVDLASYNGVFNNLDQNSGSYMRWDVSYGDLPVPPFNTQYAPVEFNFFIPEMTSYTWSSAGVPPWVAGDAGTQEDCGPNDCSGWSRTRFGPVFSQWIFIDVYYPGVQSFDFHFTDPPAAGIVVPARFSLVETNYLADGSPVGSAEGFSLTINPDGTIQDVTIIGMTLTGPGAGQAPVVPEPALRVLVAVGLAGMAAVRLWGRRPRRRRDQCE